MNNWTSPSGVYNTTEINILGITEGVGILLGCAFCIGICARVLLCP